MKAQGDLVLNRPIGTVSKLEWVTEVIGACLQVAEDQTLKDLHHNEVRATGRKSFSCAVLAFLETGTITDDY